MFNERVGYQVLATDDVVHTAGKVVTIYGLNQPSNATTTILYDGEDATGTAVITTLSTKAGDLFIFQNGIVFPNGCYVSNACTVLYKAV